LAQLAGRNGFPRLANRDPAGKRLNPCLNTFGAFALGALGLKRAYTSTLRFYQGQESSAKRKITPQTAAAPKTTWLEKTLPAVPEETSTLALAFLRSFTRAPELKMALAMNFVVLIVMAGTFFVEWAKAPPEAPLEAPFKPFLATAAVAAWLYWLSLEGMGRFLQRREQDILQVVTTEVE